MSELDGYFVSPVLKRAIDRKRRRAAAFSLVIGFIIGAGAALLLIANAMGVKP